MRSDRKNRLWLISVAPLKQKHHFNEPSVQHPRDKRCTLPLQAGAGRMIFPISVLEYG